MRIANTIHRLTPQRLRIVPIMARQAGDFAQNCAIENAPYFSLIEPVLSMTGKILEADGHAFITNGKMRSAIRASFDGALQGAHDGCDNGRTLCPHLA
jgi:6-phosphofructokinase